MERILAAAWSTNKNLNSDDDGGRHSVKLMREVEEFICWRERVTNWTFQIGST